ncbi:MAG: GNAT family N-acetyltransferase [Spirochaetes bacterium]|nr:GNAT family N-acetyltransferase [Spirochaetota bacterium]
MEIVRLDLGLGAGKGLLELWNKCLGPSFPLDARLLRQRIAVPGVEPALFAIQGLRGSLSGAAVVKRPASDAPNPSTSYISFLLVAPECRGKGMGSRLLEESESWCRLKNAQRLRLGSDPGHIFPGFPVEDSRESSAARIFFKTRGFIDEGIEEDLIADLGTMDLSLAASLPPGLECSPCKPRLRGPLDVFLASSFPGRWRADIAQGFASGTRDEDIVLLVETASETVQGFARIGDSSSPDLIPGLFWRPLLGPLPGALGPIGIAASLRGRGLGLELLRRSLAELKSRGARNTVIDWTDLGPFYARLGFVSWKRYLMMSRPL